MIKNLVLFALVLLLCFVGGAYLGTTIATPPKAEEANQLELPPEEPVKNTEIVKLNNQFVVPVLTDGTVSSLVILSISIETDEGAREKIFLLEPKLRDTLLSTMFDHANSGYFSTDFTERMKLDILRTSLREAAASVIPENIHGVLITDLVRQDSI